MDLLDFLDNLDYADNGPVVGRNFRKRLSPYDEFSNTEFKNRYRFEKETVKELTRLLTPELSHDTTKNYALSAELQVLLTLRFLATGSFQRDIGDLHGVHQTTVSRCIKRVLECLCCLKDRFIYWPDSAEMRGIKDGFYDICGFPGVLGAIDCTHVLIRNPGGADAELYRNRKGWHSINVQVVCDHQYKIRNIVPSWRGSTHDARIFRQSSLKERLENDSGQRGYLVGDGGYPCVRYLMTPIRNPSNPAEIRYNKAHSTTRVIIERVFGILKRRFPCLSFGIRFRPVDCSIVIISCAILHNLACLQNDNCEDESFDEDGMVPPDGDGSGLDRDNAQGNVKRRLIIQNYFS